MNARSTRPCSLIINTNSTLTARSTITSGRGSSWYTVPGGITAPRSGSGATRSEMEGTTGGLSVAHETAGTGGSTTGAGNGGCAAAARRTGRATLLGARAGGRATVPGCCVSRTGRRATLPAGCASRTGERGVCCGVRPGGVGDCAWTTGPRAVATCARRPTAGHQRIAAATDAAIAIANMPASRGVRRRHVGSHKDQRRRNPADLNRRPPLLRPGSCTTCVPGVARAVTGIKSLEGSGCPRRATRGVDRRPRRRIVRAWSPDIRLRNELRHRGLECTQVRVRVVAIETFVFHRSTCLSVLASARRTSSVTSETLAPP